MVHDTGSTARHATAADRAAVARVLAAAFAADPVFSYLFPVSIPRRAARLRLMFRLEAARSQRRGGTWITEDCAAAAVWFPPGHWASSRWEDLAQAPGAVAAFGRRSMLGTRARSVLETHHRELPNHWYLLYLGVEPGRQGRGLGSALLRPVLAECDRTGTPAYLEATGDRNRSLYARHGFVGRAPLPLPDGGPMVFPMWRDPG
jgi:GNAT superfamily N-acetyltransferase